MAPEGSRGGRVSSERCMPSGIALCMSRADTRDMTTSCTNCKRYVALQATADPRVFVSVNLQDGFNAYGQPQVAGERHACGERDRAAY